MSECKSCRHFEMARECADWCAEPVDYRHGKCLIRLGEHVEFRIDCGAYCQGGSVGEVSVDAVFGCKAFEVKEAPSDE